MKASTSGYPSGFTVMAPHGPCTFAMSWYYAHLPPATGGTGPRWGAGQAQAEVSCARWKIDTDTTYSAYAVVDVNEADLAWGEMTVYIRRAVRMPEPRCVPDEHRELWRQEAAWVLREMVTPGNFLTLRRTDSLAALRAARREVTMTSAALERAHESLRFHEGLAAVLALEDSTHRAIALRLLPDWSGTTEELLTTVAAIGQQEG